MGGGVALRRRAGAVRALCLVLDEFQWLCRAQPALPSILQRHWDQWQRDSVPIVVALAGSALSFMEGLLGRGSPLHGRATYRPLLGPLDYRQAAGFSIGRIPSSCSAGSGCSAVRRSTRCGRATSRSVGHCKSGSSRRGGRSMTIRCIYCGPARESDRQAATSRCSGLLLAAIRGSMRSRIGRAWPVKASRRGSSGFRNWPTWSTRRPVSRGLCPREDVPHRRAVLPVLVPLRIPQSQPARTEPRR